eukprot:TRINITY_DN4371_c0_g4_i5.p1 TRINITY_DN4371_c0_g4~~TRINITY_DN4371_c0_g4_i5.p1  ORF type:complete len:121 (-),score=21.92 TRINITY_DN4371_c0_g4_i5:311-673(-)
MSSYSNATKDNTNSTQESTRKRKSSVSSFNIMDLPSEILLHIFSFLGSWKYGSRQCHIVDVTSMVCEQWHQLSCEPSLWKDHKVVLVEEDFPKEIKKEAVVSTQSTGTLTNSTCNHFHYG